ncbi:hypothetical protein E3N88_43708 [Mikania micrantha]|uniref:Uncharacterized protein n=1 Tax=Mikania micrantha TaxID=192012 RepID=A0A5N6LEA9_9ASTR|nr:hypothetical protein E3N88_43708 [Mikania micrantha]
MDQDCADEDGASMKDEGASINILRRKETFIECESIDLKNINRFWGKRVSRKKLSIEDPPRTVIIFCFRLPSSFASDDPVVKLFEEIVMFLNSPLLNQILSTGCDDRRRFVSDFAQRGLLRDVLAILIHRSCGDSVVFFLFLISGSDANY